MGARLGPIPANPMSAAAASAHPEAMRSGGRQSNAPNALKRYGDAEPSVSAPTRIPTINPMSPLAQVDASFIPIGEMPAMQMPVTTRNAGAASEVGSTASNSAFATAPVHADVAKR